MTLRVDSNGGSEEPADLSHNLKRKVAGAAIWTVAGRWVSRLLGLVSIAVLARLLDPRDFGVVAMAQAFSTIVTAFTQLELNIALVRLKALDDDYLSTAWTLALGAGLLAAAVILLVAAPAASYYEEPDIASILMLLAIVPALSALRSPRMVLFTKHFMFDRAFYFTTSVRFVTVALTILLAFQYRDYRALVYGSIFGTVLSVTGSYLMMPWRPRASLKRRAELWGVSGWLLLRNIASVVSARVEPLLLGPAFGPERVSYYHIGKEVGGMVTGEIAQPLGKALLPAYAAAQGDKARTQRGILLGIAGITVILPVGFGAAALSNEIISVVFGEKWLPAARIFEVIAISSSVAAIGSSFGSSILVRGDVRQIAVGTLCALTVKVALVFALRPMDSLELIAVGGGLTSFGLFIYFFILGFKEMPDARRSAGPIILRPLLASLFMYLVIVNVKNLYALPAILALLVYPPAGILVFSAVLFALWTAAGRPEGMERLVVNAISGNERLKSVFRVR